jgi:tetratricopeptide (TPR) repeat protein
VHALYGLGCVAKYRADYHEAHAYFLECLSIAERLGMENEVGTVLSALSNTMTSLKDLDAAERYARRGVELCQAMGHRRLLSACLRTLGNSEFERGNREAALLCYEQSFAIAKAGAYQRSAVITLHQWGCTHFSLGMYDQALDKFQLALELSSKSKQPHFIFTAQRELANTYLALDQMTLAEDALREALLLSQVLKSDAPKAKAILTSMAWAYRAQKYDTAAALAGILMGNTDIEASVFETLCSQLKAVLGEAQFEIALAQRRHCPSLEETINDILTVMYHKI